MNFRDLYAYVFIFLFVLMALLILLADLFRDSAV